MTTLRVLSLGAGVQSSTIALMMAHGEIEPADIAIFADTGCEPMPVYEYLRYLMSLNVLPFPVHVVSAGSLVQELADAAAGNENAWGHPPIFVRNRLGTIGQTRRQCTGDYKIDPIRAEIRRILGLRPGQRVPAGIAVEQIIGISWDERRRASPSGHSWVENEFPLIDRQMRRWHCLQWLWQHDYREPPKSACTVCPMRSDVGWRWLRDVDLAGWNQAIEIDRAIRGGVRSIKGGPLFLHRSGVPLDSIDLSTAADYHEDLFQVGCGVGVCGA